MRITHVKQEARTGRVQLATAISIVPTSPVVSGEITARSVACRRSYYANQLRGIVGAWRATASQGNVDQVQGGSPWLTA